MHVARREQWRKRKVPGNGDCLHESVRVALASVGLAHTVRDLRHLTAKRVLDAGDAEMNEAVRSWMRLYRDGTLTQDTGVLSECRHVAHVHSLAPDGRAKIFENMMSSSFWGEQLSLQTMQRALGCLFLIVSTDNHENAPVAMRPVSAACCGGGGGGGGGGVAYIVLLLEGQHYTPLSFNGTFVFRSNTLPGDIKMMFSPYL